MRPPRKTEGTKKVLYVTTTEDPQDANAVAGIVLPAASLEVRRVADTTALIGALADGQGYAATVVSLTAIATLRTLHTDYEQLRETQAFEKALRERDREALANLARELGAERERRNVLERTLRHTEDQASGELAGAAERLHQVAHDTQTLQRRLELDLAERMAERDRLVDNALVGYAVFTRDGRLVRCSAKFASMLGYSSAQDALRAGADEPFAGAPDHARLVALLDRGMTVDAVESSVRRRDGRTSRVLTSAAFLPSDSGDDPQIERLFVDLSDRTALQMELNLARRLEIAGRLAVEMAPEIERSFATSPEESQPLVSQLLAFSRQQARPAGFLSLTDAVRRAEPVLRQIAGDAIDFRFDLKDVDPVAAGEDDIEHLLIELVSSAAAALPYGGRLTLATAAAAGTNFVLRTTLTATAAGYGVQSVHPSSSLARLVARCGGSVQTTDEAGRASTLLVTLPC